MTRPVKRSFRVFVVELDADAWPRRHEGRPNVFVGITSVEPHERFEQMMASSTKHQVVREHGVCPVTVTGSTRGDGTISQRAQPVCTGECDWDVAPHSRLALVAHPDPGATFVRWRGACTGTERTCVVATKKQNDRTATTVTAIFRAKPHLSKQESPANACPSGLEIRDLDGSRIAV